MQSLIPPFCQINQAIDVSTLECNVKQKTNRQVRDLEINYGHRGITVTGTSRSYYIKQLVTQAIQSHLPEANLENRILVVTS